jgi:uncharacterized membrane protein YphA (DoxX/SURF4 family)
LSAEALLSLQFIIGMVFLTSGLGKLWDVPKFARGLREYKLIPGEASTVAACVVVLAETGIAVAHLSGLFVAEAALAAVVMLGVFLSVVLRAIRRGDSVPCLCFGAGSDELASIRSVARLLLLIAAEVATLLLITTSPSPTSLPAASLEQLLLVAALSCVVMTAVRWGLSARDLYLFYDGDARRTRCGGRPGDVSRTI